MVYNYIFNELIFINYYNKIQMKYIICTSALALLTSATKLSYDSSEGPTKVDNGELDQVVVNREHDIANGYKYGGWHNPLMDADEGADDETVVL